MLFVGCFGCFGACTGKHGTLNVYLVLLGIIVLLEIAILIYGKFVWRLENECEMNSVTWCTYYYTECANRYSKVLISLVAHSSQFYSTSDQNVER